MTTREDEELKRLEVNVRRLIDQMKSQADELARLRALHEAQAARIEALEADLERAQAEVTLARVASAIGGAGSYKPQAEAYLSHVISEIEYCIGQLEQD